MGVENYLTYLITSLVFVITPGMDTLFILNHSLAKGKKAGVLASIGINAGILIHTLLAGMGLSILIANSPNALKTIKYAGAIYIAYLGIRSILESRKEFLKTDLQNQKKSQSSFRAGFITNLLNPKVILFFIAFFPQFISKDAEGLAPYFVLGMSFSVLGSIWLLILSNFAGYFSLKIKENQKMARNVQLFSGIVFLLMAGSVLWL